MNSIAVWFEKKNVNTTDIPVLELHVNHWKLRFNTNFAVRFFRWLFSTNNDYFMDFGIKIQNGTSVDKVCLFIPNEITDKDKIIEDLGQRLSDKSLITAVFNEPYNIETINNEKYFVVKDKNGPIFNIYKLDISNDISLTSQYGGTIIKFDFKTFSNLPTYYRIRLKSSFVKNLSYIFNPSNSFLESAYSSIEIIDFRINDTRNLNLSLVEHINRHSKFNISLMHYFVMRDVKDEYILSNQDLNSVRQLENDIWTPYIDVNEHIYKRAFAYHLKKKASGVGSDITYIEEFSAVLKFRFEDSKLIKYFIYIFIFAMITEVLGSGLYVICEPYLKMIYHFLFHCEKLSK